VGEGHAGVQHRDAVLGHMAEEGLGSSSVPGGASAAGAEGQDYAPLGGHGGGAGGGGRGKGSGAPWGERRGRPDGGMRWWALMWCHVAAQRSGDACAEGREHGRV